MGPLYKKQTQKVLNDFMDVKYLQYLNEPNKSSKQKYSKTKKDVINL